MLFDVVKLDPISINRDTKNSLPSIGNSEDTVVKIVIKEFEVEVIIKDNQRGNLGRDLIMNEGRRSICNQHMPATLQDTMTDCELY